MSVVRTRGPTTRRTRRQQRGRLGRMSVGGIGGGHATEDDGGAVTKKGNVSGQGNEEDTRAIVQPVWRGRMLTACCCCRR